MDCVWSGMEVKFFFGYRIGGFTRERGSRVYMSLVLGKARDW